MFVKLLKNPKFVLVLTLLLVIPFVSFNLINGNKEEPVLAQKNQASPAISSVPSPISSPSPSPLPKMAIKKTSKSNYTIALYGDSMIDTMGELQYLQHNLETTYPKTTFKLYNYGIGSQNVTQGLERFTKPFAYQNRSYPPINQIKSDLIIIGSFSYNPFAPHNKDKHYSDLKKLISEAQKLNVPVYLLLEIAPLETEFGNGPGGVNWQTQDAKAQATRIVEQLESAKTLARALNIPTINAYDKSKVNAKYGNSVYVSKHDGIHPSEEGHILTSTLIASTLKLP